MHRPRPRRRRRRGRYRLIQLLLQCSAISNSIHHAGSLCLSLLRPKSQTSLRPKNWSLHRATCVRCQHCQFRTERFSWSKVLLPAHALADSNYQISIREKILEPISMMLPAWLSPYHLWQHTSCLHACASVPNRVRPILVSGIGQYSPVSVGIGIDRYSI